jgi:arylsulfatase A-like enzyme
LRGANLLVITTDQQRCDTMACYGNEQIQTPALNTLGAESFVFENAYCVTPICSPSRASYLTGQWPQKHQCIANNTPLAPDVQTIADLMAEDYRCAYYGKWHLGDEIVPRHGFKERVSTEDGKYRPYYSRPEYLELRSDYHHFLTRNGFVPDRIAPDGAAVFSRGFAAALAEPYTKPMFLADQAERFLRAHADDRPFFLAVSFLEPHNPFWSPLNNLYDPTDLKVGPSFAQPPDGAAPIRVRMMSHEFAVRGIQGWPLRTEWEWRRLRANYYGLVTLVDRAVGKILAALEQAGYEDNTVVVFTSDHGEMMGDHGLVTKGLRYEQAVKVPLLMRVPWLSRSETRVGGSVSLVDLVPTLLDLLEQGPGRQVQGRSQAGVLRGESDLSANDVIIAWYGDGESTYWENISGEFSRTEIETAAFGQWRTIISPDRWKLTLSPRDVCELYDLSNDPHELRNLFEDPPHRGRTRELSARLGRWQQETGDTLPLPGA